MYNDIGGLTNRIGKPFLFQVFRIPNVFGKIGDTLVHVDEFNQFGVKVGIAEGAVGHQGVIKMLWIMGVAF